MLSLLVNPVVLGFVAVPLAGLGATYAWIHARLRQRRGAQWNAIRHALVASWFSLLGWTLYVLQAIALEHGRGTAILSIIRIASVGIPLGIVVLPVAWSLSLLVQSLPLTRRGESRLTWLRLAWGIAVLTGIVCAASGYSALLERTARTETSADELRALYDRWWARHDTAVLEALARNARTPADVLADLASHDDAAIRYGVALNPGTPAAVLERLYEEVHTRTSLAVNPSASPAMLRKLATDADYAVRHNLLFNPSLPVDVLDTLEKDPEVGRLARARLQHRLEGSKWCIVAPPETWEWSRPFTAVPDDDAPIRAWRPTSFAFDTQDACEATRSELIRREANPHRGLRPTCWDCQAPDFYSHTRCAHVQR